ncbi:odorant receptor 49a-like [Colletes latitarsis]|uniref:odorant receptor 49a-like n=1 Tax=Colletes latitarsis TaxID=2605962 RepID=UPI004036D0E3
MRCNSDKYRYKIRKATENNNVTKNGGASKANEYQDFRQCVIVHNKAIKFFEFLDNLNRKNYLIQIGLNMIGISITAFQTVVHLLEPDQAFRYCIFFAAQNFHLFILSLPGQVLVDYSLDLATNIYMSQWYQAPLEVQRLLRTMQIRCSKPCSLTAGGLYEMNIENFGMTFKTCMSYFTMLLSMKQ